ncbi:MAG: sulfatase [Spirochaetaceae bacterium]|nr:MAG: sulfatase [Spirochaetaceae bacterium]
MKKPNIVFLHSHNTGCFVEPYGHPVPTPNLMRLAHDGVVFRRAFSAAPTCSPSRGGFLTGTWPHVNGLMGLAHRGWKVSDPSMHLANTLKRAGYHTALIGVEHTGFEELSAENGEGYDEVLDVGDRTWTGVAAAASRFFSGAREQPFFVSIGLRETHIPFPEPDPERGPSEDPRYCRPFPRLPDTPELRREMAAFAASARHMDQCYGSILDDLDSRGLADNTLLFCFSDHGIQLPYGIANLYDTGISVYCIARGPTGTAFRGGKSIDAMVSLLDLYPTACEAAGIDIPGHVQGTSLNALVNGGTTEIHDAVFSEQSYHAAYEPTRCVRTDRHKLIRRFDDRQTVVLPNVDDTESKAFLLKHGWLDQPRDSEMLFDLYFDPYEHNNVIERPEYSSIVVTLRERLSTWMRSTHDPLLDGAVPAPENARHNDPNQTSPKDPVG